MTPEKVIEAMFSWLPVIVIGAFLVNYVVNIIRGIWSEWRD